MRMMCLIMTAYELTSSFAEVMSFRQGLAAAARKYVLAARWYDLHSFALSFAFLLPDMIVLLYHLETPGQPRVKQL